MFPKDKVLRKKWIHAIRREEGSILRLLRPLKSAPGISGQMTSPAPRESREGTTSVIADSEADGENTLDDVDCDSLNK